MNVRRNFFLASLTLTVFLSACSQEVSQKVQFSNDGFIPESYLPDDLGVVLSYSTQEEGQRAALSAMEAVFGDENRVSEAASRGLGLDFERDLKPALGESFRIVYGLRSDDSEEEAENFAVITLEDTAQMKSVLEVLAKDEHLNKKQLSGMEAYAKDDGLFMTIHEDMLFLASTGENLLSMTEQEEDSLWENELYRDTLDEIGADYLLFGVMFPSLYSQELSLPAGLSVGEIPSVVDQQVVVVRAEEKGLRFDAWMNANKEKAMEADITFDRIPRPEPYLFEEIPSEGLMAYFESYGLAQTFNQAEALGGNAAGMDQMKTVFRNYFGMDFEEFMSFMDKGYSIAFHQDGSSALPGITLYVDSSSNADQAEEFITRLDSQIGGLLVLAEQVLPGAMRKDTVNWGDSKFSRLTLDLTSLAQVEGSPIPSALIAKPIELVYGTMDNRLLVSTMSDWDPEGLAISESALYKELSAQSGEQSEGLILVDIRALSNYLEIVEPLFGNSLVNEGAIASGQSFFDGFLGAIAQSQAGKYESHFGGFLMLAN